jgi:hypothetical protein
LKAHYQYREVLQEVWYSQDQELVDTLINSILWQVQAVIEANKG